MHSNKVWSLPVYKLKASTQECEQAQYNISKTNNLTKKYTIFLKIFAICNKILILLKGDLPVVCSAKSLLLYHCVFDRVTHSQLIISDYRVIELLELFKFYSQLESVI